MNPFLEAMEVIERYPGTGGSGALAKCVLSLWNSVHCFSMAEILGPLDQSNSALVVRMVQEYAQHGESDELRTAGSWVYRNNPGLVEISDAQQQGRHEVRRRWELEREREAEAEERRDEEHRQWREANAKELHCTYCARDTKHRPGDDGYECEACYTLRSS